MASEYGRWKVISSIGEGGQTHVYRVKDEDGQREGEYVLKRLKNIKRIGRFKSEIEARNRLDHPNIVKLIDYDLEGAKPYLVEVYFPAGNLLRNRGVFEGDLLRTLKLFRQVCSALATAHESEPVGVHRDIKPENVLYNPLSPSLHITDFGICFVEGATRETMFGEKVGPRDYICPEMERGRADKVSPACDVYSLGKLLYWMLSGSTLYREEHRTKEAYLVKTFGDAQYERIHQLLDKCVDQETQARSPNARGLLDELDKTIRLVEKEANVVNRYLPQKCLYCHHGQYILSRYVNTEELDMSRALSIAFNRDRDQRLMFGVCAHCGNIQIFMEDENNPVWDRKLLPKR